MARLFKIFNFQDAVQEIREQVSNKGGLEPCFKLLQAITDDMQLEDMPFYNQYLSKFDLEQSFSGYKLLLDDDIDASPEDINLLQRFIFGSFSCKYEITFNDKDKTYAIKIIASYENVTDSKLLHDFSYLRIKNLMTIILKEQLNLEGFRDEDEVSTELIDEQREEKLIEFKDHINRQKSSK